jgi:hypothetical protein
MCRYKTEEIAKSEEKKPDRLESTDYQHRSFDSANTIAITPLFPLTA